MESCKYLPGTIDIEILNHKSQNVGVDKRERAEQKKTEKTAVYQSSMHLTSERNQLINDRQMNKPLQLAEMY